MTLIILYISKKNKTNKYWKLTVSSPDSWTTEKFFEATLEIWCLLWLVKILKTTWVGVRPEDHWLSIGYSFSRSWQQPLIHWFLHCLSCRHCSIWNEQWKNIYWLNEWLSKSVQVCFFACKHEGRKAGRKEVRKEGREGEKEGGRNVGGRLSINASWFLLNRLCNIVCHKCPKLIASLWRIILSKPVEW